MVPGLEPVIFWIFASAALAFAVATMLTRSFCDPESRLHWLDHPNERSLHSRPTPRTGGVAIVAGIVAAVPVWLLATGGAADAGWLLAGAGVIAGVSFLDDRSGLPVAVRLIGHLAGAGLVVIGSGFALPSPASGIVPAWLGLSVSILFLVWMLNLYNFMDGMDGLAGGMAVTGFGTFAVFGLIAGNFPFAMLSLVIAAAAGGFLLFNFPPARIFMGDTGSATLGLLAGSLGLWGVRDGVLPFWAALLVFSPFIVDASVTLLRRLLRGERVWEAHKTHYYQRLVQSGWGHRKTVLYEYALMLGCGLSALLGAWLAPGAQGGVIGFWTLVYLVIMAWVHRMDGRANS